MKDAPTDAPNTADADTAPVADDTATATLEEPTDADDSAAAAETTEAAEAKASKEAARYRRRLREAEGERDTLAERLAALQRTEAERIGAEHLADAADLWRDGTDIAALLDDDGHLDPAKVAEAAARVAAAHPHWRRPKPTAQIRRGGLNSGATSPTDQLKPTWASVLRGANR